MNVIQLVATSGFLTVNKVIAREVGLEAAALLGELASTQVYWEERGELNEDGMFFETAEQIEQNTTLTAYQQGKASKVLEGAGLIRTTRKGVPAKKYFVVDADGLSAFFKNKFPSFLETRNQKTEKLDSQKLGSIKKRDNKKREERKDKYNTVSNSLLSEPVKDKVMDFLAYREEIKKPYKSERSIQSFVNQVVKQEQIHGSIAVIECIDKSIRNGWQGVFWDKIETPAKDKLTEKLEAMESWGMNNAEQGIF